jgi:hypothetical protein
VLLYEHMQLQYACAEGPLLHQRFPAQAHCVTSLLHRFAAGVTSPQPSMLVPSSGSRTYGPSAAGAALRTPYPSHLHDSNRLTAGTPSSCGVDDDDAGFVLFTSQNYVRQSQPAISPSFAAGLSAGPEEEPTTTPSQDSRVSSCS